MDFIFNVIDPIFFILGLLVLLIRLVLHFRPESISRLPYRVKTLRLFWRWWCAKSAADDENRFFKLAINQPEDFVLSLKGDLKLQRRNQIIQGGSHSQLEKKLHFNQMHVFRRKANHALFAIEKDIKAQIAWLELINHVVPLRSQKSSSFVRKANILAERVGDYSAVLIALKIPLDGPCSPEIIYRNLETLNWHVNSRRLMEYCQEYRNLFGSEISVSSKHEVFVGFQVAIEEMEKMQEQLETNASNVELIDVPTTYQGALDSDFEPSVE